MDDTSKMVDNGKLIETQMSGNDKKDVKNGPNTELKRHLSLYNVVSLMISITGHVAIFMTPGSIVTFSGSIGLSMIIWFAGGFFVYTLALCFAELCTIYQRAGGPYLYISLTFGPLPGFLLAWGYIILISGPFLAWTSYTTAVYIIRAAIRDNSCDNAGQETATLIIAVLINVLLMYLNCRHLKLVVKIQSFLTITKIVMIFSIVISGLYLLVTGSTENFEEPMRDSSTDPGRISLALLIVVFSNGGWQAVTTLTEEVTSPAKTIPRAIHLTFLFSVCVNFLTIIGYMVVLDATEIKGSDAIAILFWQRIWPPLIPIVSVAVALAAIGAANTGVMGHSRLLMAAARQGVMPEILSTLNPTHKTPMVAVGTITCYGLVMLAVGSAAKMVQFIGLFSFIMGFNIALAVVYLRIAKPHLPRPYKVSIVLPFMQLVFNAAMFVLVVYQEPNWMLVGVAIYLAGIPVYVFTQAPKPLAYRQLTGLMTALLQKCFVQVPSK